MATTIDRSTALTAQRNARLQIRIPKPLLDQLFEEVEKRRQAGNKKITASTLVIAAIQEKLNP